jgi:hypothetical protein
MHLMMQRLLRPRTRWLLAATLVVAGCFFVREAYIEEVPRGHATVVRSPVKAYLKDGSIVVFPLGVIVGGDSVRGIGTRHLPTLEATGSVTALWLADIVGMESFNTRISPEKSVGLSVLVTALGKGIITYGMTNGDVSPLKAIFGSCPTIYSDSAGAPLLEAESFSYSIAPLLAKRDVDRLRVQPDARGIVRLEVRNEALETHYIDQFELLEIVHGPDELVYPAPYGAPLALRDVRVPARVRDRAGRDLTRLIAQADTLVFATDSATLSEANGADARDWIDIAVPRPAHSDSIAIALRMRSSLLTTMLFYDYMLKQPGARALDFLAQDLAHITTLVGFGRWYADQLGLKVEVLNHGKYRQLARLADFGPIAYRHVAVVMPVGDEDSVRVRISFLADQWRIDRIAVAEQVRRAATRKVSLARVLGPRGSESPELIPILREQDEQTVYTLPGERFFLEFAAGKSEESRTFLLAAHGHYAEWVRGAWLREAAPNAPAFKPDAHTVDRLLRDWRLSRDSLEAQFFRYRVPVL